MREVPEQRARVRILAYMAPSPRFVEAAPLHMKSTLIVREMGSGKTTFIEAKLGEAVRSLLGQGVMTRGYTTCMGKRLACISY